METKKIDYGTAYHNALEALRVLRDVLKEEQELEDYNINYWSLRTIEDLQRINNKVNI